MSTKDTASLHHFTQKLKDLDNKMPIIIQVLRRIANI